MKKLLSALLISTAIVAPQAATARPVEVTAELKNYRGPNAYIGVYLVGPDGQFHSSLAVAGHKQKYQQHLRGWFRGVSRTGSADVISGASVGGGRTLKITADIADALIDAGYSIQVDTAVEDYGDFRADAIAPLSPNANAELSNRGVVQSLFVKM